MKKLIVLAILAFGLTACQTNRSYAGRGVGTALGAGAGALIGEAAGGHAAEGAAIGAGVGFLGGGMYDEEVNAQQQDRRDAYQDQELGRLRQENQQLRNDVEVDRLRRSGYVKQRVYNSSTGQWEERWVPPSQAAPPPSAP